MGYLAVIKKRWTDEHQIEKGAWNILLIKYNLKVCIYFDTELQLYMTTQLNSKIMIMSF